MLTVLPAGGTLRIIGETLFVDDADHAVILLTAQTSFRCGDPEAVCRQTLESAARQPYEQLRSTHAADYQSLFQRVTLSLDDDQPGADQLALLPTDERLARMREGEADQGLIALYFHYGRYLLMSSSRPGSLPANLQGIWNQDFVPAWDSKYTININAQMNYWPAETCHLQECHEPLFDLLERMRIQRQRDCASHVWLRRLRRPS